MKQMTVWDWGSTILEVAVGFTLLGILYGLYEAVEGGDSKEIGLALLAFVPVGDALKVLKRIQKKGEAALKKGFYKLEEVVNEGFDRLGVPDNRAGKGWELDMGPAGRTHINPSNTDDPLMRMGKWDPDKNQRKGGGKRSKNKKKIGVNSRKLEDKELAAYFDDPNWHKKDSTKKGLLKEFEGKMRGDTNADFYLDKGTNEILLRTNLSKIWIKTGMIF